ncbi:hypothetical protein [Pseudoramibacter faecis]|uniref:hypothetical protein n=1 Tax=Pseudoramibacter faecis TaxID=3108534 RepID=UPI002E760ED9|nr:hypothetical protein [Pseudoramibacter sp. HA2172]
MSNHKKNKHKKKNNHYDPAQRETHQTVKPWHRIGAMVLVIALIVGIIAMYGLSYTG